MPDGCLISGGLDQQIIIWNTVESIYKQQVTHGTEFILNKAMGKETTEENQLNIAGDILQAEDYISALCVLQDGRIAAAEEGSYQILLFPYTSEQLKGVIKKQFEKLSRGEIHYDYAEIEVILKDLVIKKYQDISTCNIATDT